LVVNNKQQGKQMRVTSEASLAIFDYIECFYNIQRIHQSLGYLTPVDMEKSMMHSNVLNLMCPIKAGYLMLTTIILCVVDGCKDTSGFGLGMRVYLY
jgi:hypothetical protein